MMARVVWAQEGLLRTTGLMTAQCLLDRRPVENAFASPWENDARNCAAPNEVTKRARGVEVQAAVKTFEVGED